MLILANYRVVSLVVSLVSGGIICVYVIKGVNLRKIKIDCTENR